MQVATGLHLEEAADPWARLEKVDSKKDGFGVIK